VVRLSATAAEQQRSALRVRSALPVWDRCGAGRRRVRGSACARVTYILFCWNNPSVRAAAPRCDALLHSSLCVG
jgi:hypothetical protein